MTKQESRWRYEAANGIRNLNMKRRAKGRDRHGRTYAEYREWFKGHFEAGVRMGINPEDKLLNEVKLGMCVPNWSLVAVLR